MDDEDLQKIRQARLQELAQQSHLDNGGGSSSQADQQKATEDETRRNILSQVLTPDASDRLGRIALVKESRARELENRLVQMARSGQIRQRVTDEDLRAMLAGASEAEKESEKKIVFQRRKGVLDDSDDDWD